MEDGAVALRGAACERVRGLGRGAFKQGVTQSDGFVRDRFEKVGPDIGSELPERIKGSDGECDSRVDLASGRLKERGMKRRSGSGI